MNVTHNKTENDMLVENIIIDLVLGIVSLIVLCALIILMRYKFKMNHIDEVDRNNVVRIPNPLYDVQETSV
jgi:hypothetical protein